MVTTYFMNLIMGNTFRTQTTPAIPTAYYLGLSSTTPTISGTNVTEPSGGGYARKQLTVLSTPTGGVITNSSSIDFAESTATWGVMTNYVIYDALTSGNLLMYGTLTSSRTIESENIATIKSGGLTLQLSNPA